jgi:hypothetical protein
MLVVVASPDDDPLAEAGIELAAGDALPEVRAETTRIARMLAASKMKILGLVPADDRVAVPPIAIQIGHALCDLTGSPVAVVDANVRYPGLSQLAGRGEVVDRDRTLYSTRWLHGSLALLTPPHSERAGEVVPQLARFLLDGVEIFAHVLCDLTGLELIGEHASAAACMDGVMMVARAHRTREADLLALRRLMPADRFLGVLLVG